MEVQTQPFEIPAKPPMSTLKKWLIGIGIIVGLIFFYYCWQYYKAEQEWDKLSYTQQEQICYAAHQLGTSAVIELADHSLTSDHPNFAQKQVLKLVIDDKC